MTKQQAATVTKQDAQARALHTQEMMTIDPTLNPNVPAVVKFLDQTISPGI
jgi:hypothetical protein